MRSDLIQVVFGDLVFEASLDTVLHSETFWYEVSMRIRDSLLRQMGRHDAVQLGIPYQYTPMPAAPTSVPLPVAQPAFPEERNPEFGIVMLVRDAPEYVSRTFNLTDTTDPRRPVVIHEGESFDTSVRKWLIVTDRSSYNRLQAEQVREQIEQLIPRSVVFILPVTG